MTLLVGVGWFFLEGIVDFFKDRSANRQTWQAERAGRVGAAQQAAAQQVAAARQAAQQAAGGQRNGEPPGEGGRALPPGAGGAAQQAARRARQHEIEEYGDLLNTARRRVRSAAREIARSAGNVRRNLQDLNEAFEQGDVACLREDHMLDGEPAWGITQVIGVYDQIRRIRGDMGVIARHLDRIEHEVDDQGRNDAGALENKILGDSDTVQRLFDQLLGLVRNRPEETVGGRAALEQLTQFLDNTVVDDANGALALIETAIGRLQG